MQTFYKVKKLFIPVKTYAVVERHTEGDERGAFVLWYGNSWLAAQYIAITASISRRLPHVEVYW